MSGYEVDPNDMQAVAVQMDQANQDINTTMQALLNQLQPLASHWKGPAYTAFNTAQMRWHEVAQKHNLRLAEISQALTQTNKNYSANEEAGTASFNRFDGVLNP